MAATETSSAHYQDCAWNLDAFGENLKDRRWRLSHLYWIVDQDGSRVQFIPNRAQLDLLSQLHWRNVILKARQLGFTTLIDLFGLDLCLFNSNVTAGIIAHRMEDVRNIFRKKVKYPYENLPGALLARIPAIKCDSNELLLKNNSNLRVGISMRSDTIQFLHVSEHGKLCARYPLKAEELATGTFPACHDKAIVFVESTAEGPVGDFARLCKRSEQVTASARQTGRRLGNREFRFHFFPWFRKPSNTLPDDEAKLVEISDKDHAYFDSVEARMTTRLRLGQRAWYVFTRDGTNGLGTKMTQEHPSTPEEAFRAAIEGSYYGEQMGVARSEGRIGHVAYDPAIPVYTFWDLGMRDSMTIWFAQFVGREVHLIDYYENSGQGLKHYIKVLRDRPYVYAEDGHWAPQDIKVRELGSGVSRWETARELGIEFRVGQEHNLQDGIDAVRNVIPFCWFDATKCQRGIECLEAYRTAWNDKLERFDDKPLHDWSSHGADAFRYLSVAYRFDRIVGRFLADPLKGLESPDGPVDDDYDPLELGLRRTV